MSVSDDDPSYFFGSAKVESDRKASLGTDQHRMPHAGPPTSSGSGGGGLVSFIFAALFWLITVALPFAAKAIYIIFRAIFSRR